MSSNNPNLNGSHNYTQLPRLFSLVCLSSVCFTDVLNMSKSRSEQWLNHAESTRIGSPCGSKVLAPRYQHWPAPADSVRQGIGTFWCDAFFASYTKVVQVCKCASYVQSNIPRLGIRLRLPGLSFGWYIHTNTIKFSTFEDMWPSLRNCGASKRIGEASVWGSPRTFHAKSPKCSA